MNRILKKTSLIMTLIISIFLLVKIVSFNGSAFSAIENGIKFSSINGHICVSGVEDKTITDLIIPETIQGYTVEMVYLDSISNITSIMIPSSVTDINIKNCSNISAYYVDENNKNFCSQDGIVYDKNFETIYLYPPNKSDDIFVVPEGIKKIEAFAFAYCTNLKEIILPDNLSEICAEAFNSCTFEIINLPISLKTIGNYAFSCNKNLKEIIIPENVENIYQPFYGCDNLETLILLRETKFIPTSSLMVEDMDYFDLLYDQSHKITVYVPDNKVYEYSSMSMAWYNTESEVLPLSEMSCEMILGDVNFDQTLSISDVIMLQKGLTNYDCVKMWKAGDMDGNENVDIFDLIIMKREIINSLS